MEQRIRLRRSGDIRRAYEEGQTWAHPLMVVVARPNGLDFSRVGVAASRKVGSAVTRNRAKRLMREAARRLYPRLASGWDLMLVARATIVGAKEPQVREALLSLLKKAGLIGLENGES